MVDGILLGKIKAMNLVNVSVIIPTRNRSQVIVKALDSLAMQIFPLENYEVIVIDNASTDDTKKVVDGYMNKISNLRYFYEAKPGLHNGRHRGAKEAKGWILAYLDDDVLVTEKWLEGIYESFNSYLDVGIVTGNILPKYEISPPRWLMSFWKNNKYGKDLGWLSLLDLGNRYQYIPSYLAWGCNLAVKKNIVYLCGGFHPDSMPKHLLKYRGDGETGLGIKAESMQIRTLFSPKATIFHCISKERMTLNYFCTRGFAQGISHSFSQSRLGIKTGKLMLSFLKRWAGKYLSLAVNYRKVNWREAVLWLFYGAGFFFHQGLIIVNHDVRDWVLRKTYIEEE